MRNVIEVDTNWLVEVAPHFYKLDDFMKKQEKYQKKDRKV